MGVLSVSEGGLTGFLPSTPFSWNCDSWFFLWVHHPSPDWASLSHFPWFRSDTPGRYQPERPRQHFHSRWNPEGAWSSITNREGSQQFIQLHGAGELCCARDTPAVCHDGPQQTEACHVSSFYPAEMQGETLFTFILLSSPLPFPTPLAVPLLRIAWIRSRALKCILNHKRTEVLLCLSCGIPVQCVLILLLWAHCLVSDSVILSLIILSPEV